MSNNIFSATRTNKINYYQQDLLIALDPAMERILNILWCFF